LQKTGTARPAQHDFRSSDELRLQLFQIDGYLVAGDEQVKQVS
jgi:hypothetical protein